MARRVLGWVVTLALVAHLRAEEGTFHMGEVTVVGTRTEESLLNVPQSVTIANLEEIGRRQSPSAALMLREEPGVWVQRTGSSGGSPILRGQIGNRVLYLWDGVRVNNGALFGGPNAFLNQINPGAIDHIEVLRGPGSVQYGSDAIGGVVSVHTRRVTDYPDEGVHYGGASTSRHGSADDLVSEDSYAWVSTHHFSVLAGGGLQDFKDYDGGGGFGTVDDTQLETHGGYAKVGWKPSAQHLLELSFQRFDRDNVHQYIQSKTNASGIATLFTPNEERDLAKLSYEGRDLASWLSSLDAYAYAQQFDTLSNRVTESAARFDNRKTTGDQSIYGVGFQGVSPVRLGREHTLLWGGDYRLEKLGSSVRIERTTKATGAVTEFEPQGNTPDGAYEVWDALARMEISLGENLTISPGVRYEVTHLGSATRRCASSPRSMETSGRGTSTAGSTPGGSRRTCASSRATRGTRRTTRSTRGSPPTPGAARPTRRRTARSAATSTSPATRSSTCAAAWKSSATAGSRATSRSCRPLPRR